MRRGIGIGAAALTLLAFGAGGGHAAVVAAPPTFPIPADAPPGPPLIPIFPSPGATPPPADQIADPVTPSASCGGWYVQGTYGGRWPAGSSWWEYQCSDDEYSSYNPCSGGGACDAFCPSCWEQIEDRTDYFYWNGSDAVFYGQDNYYFFQFTETGDDTQETSDWWDASAAQWYNTEPELLTVSTDGAGSGVVVGVSPSVLSCTSFCQPSFAPGTVVSLSATADAGSTFAGWSGDCSGSGTCQVTMNQAHSVVATFTPSAYGLTVTKQGTGSGLVSSNPAGISCGSACQASLAAGSTVTLTASPDSDSVFAGWSGDCSGTSTCQVTMSQARFVTAMFAPNVVTLTVTKLGTGSGLVTSSPAGISCGSACQASLAAGSTVTLTASPVPGSVFAGWSGDCSGTGTCRLTMSAARSATATFSPNIPPSPSFTLTCTSLDCKFDAGGSTDPDDAIVNYAWSFGDATSGSNSSSTISHTYPKAGVYTVTLTVTDGSGAGASDSKTFNPISVSARGYKQSGHDKVDLSWNGVSGTSFDVYRNGSRVATVQATSYTDSLSRTITGTYTYTVCATTDTICSNTANVSF